MKILYLFTFLLGSLSLSAQQWQTELPYTSVCPECEIRDFITTNDNGFLVLLTTLDEEEEDFLKIVHTMIKYDSLGSLKWEKNYDFGAIGPWGSSDGGGATPTKVIQLENSNYMMTGGFRDIDTTFAYILITDSIGDSVSFFHSPSNFDLQYVNEEIFVRRLDDSNLSIATKLNNTGVVIEEADLEEGVVAKFLVSKNQSIYAYRELNPTSYKKYNQVGELLYEILTPDRATHLIENEIGGITAYSSDLIKMDSNLNIMWQYSHEEIYPGIPDDGHDGTDIIQTVDGGCIITGYIIDEFFSGVFMSKYDTEGDRLWGGLYPLDARKRPTSPVPY